jgi:SNF2 family DNA or RNA helicase
MLAEKPPAKPILLVAPAEVLSQWIADMEQLSEDFIHVMYYGSKNSSSLTNTKIDGILTRGSKYFNGDDRNARTVILTSPETLRARHGPSQLRNYRTGTLGWTTEAAMEAFSQTEPT